MNNTAFNADNIIKSFSGISSALVRSLTRLEGGHDTTVLLAAALVSRAAEEGHACIDLSKLAAQPFGAADGPARDLSSPSLAVWCQHLQASPLVGTSAQWRPLILDRRHFLYLQRFFHYERMIAKHLTARAQQGVSTAGLIKCAERLQQYFPDAATGVTDWQRVAAEIALKHRLCIISGAPGTGKTTTAARIIRLLIDVYGPHPLRFALCAPTGKAAARLSETLRSAADGLPGQPDSRKRFPVEVSTIHRLLGYRRHRFIFNATNPLPADVVVVDEASMIDLALMAQLLEAIPPEARLIILGDHHQLSSVEAGAVFGDICQGVMAARRDDNRHPPLDPPLPDAPVPLNANVVILTRNYRFDDKNGIGALVQAVNAGNVKGVRELLHGRGAEIEWRQTPLDDHGRLELQQIVIEGYRPVFEARSVNQALDALGNFMVLGAMIGGPWGTDRLNLWIETLLRQEGWIENPDIWYPGRPVMILRNDYRSGLFNGDTGIVWPDSAHGSAKPRVWFRMSSGPLQSFAPQALTAHQTAYALTVHKAQGSEYRQIVLALPEQDSPVLTRELLYTGLSRARQQIWLVAGESILDLAVNRRIDRASGLKAALECQSPSTACDKVKPDSKGESER